MGNKPMTREEFHKGYMEILDKNMEWELSSCALITYLKVQIETLLPSESDNYRVNDEEGAKTIAEVEHQRIYWYEKPMEMKRHNLHLERDLDTHHTTIKEKRERIQQLEKENNLLRANYEKGVSDWTQVLGEKRELEKELSEYKKQVEGLTSERDQYRTSMYYVANRLEHVGKELEEWKGLAEELMGDIEHCSEDEWPGQTAEYLKELKDKYLKENQE